MIRPTLKDLTKGQRRLSVMSASFALLFLWLAGLIFAQDKAATVGGHHVGERLTYNVSFGQFQNVAYAELYTVSRGKLSGRDALELRARIKTLDLVGAQFVSIDESRTTFASIETGYPLYISKIQNDGVEPKETTVSYLSNPATSCDLLTLIGKIREASGVGSFNITENDKTYTVTLSPAGVEKVKTAAGEFDTSVSTVESSYLTENGMTELKLNLSADERRLPVQFTFKAKTRRGTFRATLASVETVAEPEATPSPEPLIAPTPVVIRTPPPSPTPLPYVDNQPISPELPFGLGETLDYKVSSASRAVGLVTLTVKERKLLAGKDSLLLSAQVRSLESGEVILDVKDSLTTYVNPDLLTPRQSELRFYGGLRSLSQVEQFDQSLGLVTLGAGKTVDVPIGTQDLLSFIYALRTFNLKPNKDSKNPINDTRVAVFWDSKAYIFTLRPSSATLEDASGRKRDCILVAVNTGNPQLDQLAIKIWLSTDARKLPLRIVFGNYQADLIRPE